MKKNFLWIGVFILLGGVGFALTSFIIGLFGEIDSKGEWGALQSIEYDNRSKSLVKPVIVAQNGVNFLGIPNSNTSGPQIWILLRSDSPPFYKQMPEGSYSLSKEDYQKVQSSGLASSTVLAVLSSHIGSKK
jgi:hypothetical protein